jgi:hypothetical protein
MKKVYEEMYQARMTTIKQRADCPIVSQSRSGRELPSRQSAISQETENLLIGARAREAPAAWHHGEGAVPHLHRSWRAKVAMPRAPRFEPPS